MRMKDALNDLIDRVMNMVARENLDQVALAQVFDVRERIVLPVCRRLEKSKEDRHAKTVMDLYLAVEEYAVRFADDPDGREERAERVDMLVRRVRSRLLGDEDREADVEKLLDDIRQWQWKATLDESGRIAFATGSGVAVPARGAIIQQVGAQVIEQATRAQRPYSDDVRPRDVRNEPGGLVNIRDARRAIIVGDLHGRYDNLEAILRDKSNLKSVIEGESHLVFLGDAIHPPSSLQNTDKDYEDSFAVMLLIMTLKAENPFNVHYIIGNHDNAHVGGFAVGKSGERQDTTFEAFIRDKVGESVLERYREFVLNCPAAVMVYAADGAILIVHATVSDQILNEQGLINVFVQGRRGKALGDLLWSRDFDPERIERLAARVGARFVVGGHTVPSETRARSYNFKPIGPLAFGLVGKVQLIVCAQCDVFGYLDVDLTRPLPDDVDELRAPDGKYACRMLQPAKKPEDEIEDEEM